MRGDDRRTGRCSLMLISVSEVRADHPLRAIRDFVNAALAAMSADFEALYSRLGRPSIAPERLLRALLLQCFYSVRSERQLMERLEFDLLFRWFVGLGVDDPGWDASVFSKNRDRLLAGEVAQRFLAELLAPISSASAKAAESSDTPAPTAWIPSTRLLSARATTRTKPSSAAERHRAAVGGRRGTGRCGSRAPLRFASSGREAGGDDLGVGEADRRDAALVPAAAVAGDDLGDHLALRHGPVRQHRLAGDVADGVDAAHRGAALVVDADERAVAVEVESPRAPSRRWRAGGRR